MPDKRDENALLRQQAFVFEASFNDNTRLNIYIDADFENQESAMREAKRYVHRIGKLPTSLRKGLRRFVVHKGGKDTTAFADKGLIIVYSENATKRISTHDLEETIFHESVHASWDPTHASSERWVRAQAADGTFATLYGKKKPQREDLAESAIFAYTLLHHPERIPHADALKLKKAIPNRIRYIAELLPPNKPIFYNVESRGKEEPNADSSSDQTNEFESDSNESFGCNIQLVGTFADVLSNALMRTLEIDEKVVNRVTDNKKECETSEELFQIAVEELKLDEAVLKKAIIEMLHCNCDHAKSKDTEKIELIESWKAKAQK